MYKGVCTLKNNISNSIKQFLKDRSFKKIYVGFSGGADSTCLLVVLKELALELDFQITAVHFEHGLRGKLSVADAQWCRNFCLKNSIEYLEYSFSLKNENQSGNIEAVARSLRFEKFKELIKHSDDEVIALGHHSGDRIENLLIRLFRGSNTSALTSLRVQSEVYNLNIIRPLINFSKKEIEEFLRNIGINDWRIDHTNAESDYRRNFFRNKVLPVINNEIPNSEIGIIRAIEAMTEDAECLEEIAQSKFKEVQNNKTIDIKFLKNMHNAVLIRVLRYWLSDKLNYDFIPNKNFIERVKLAINTESNEKKLVPLNDEDYLLFNNNELSIYEETKRIDSVNWEWKNNSEIIIGNYRIKAEIMNSLDINPQKTEDAVFFDADSFSDKLLIRGWIEGDKMVPFGRKSEVKLKKIFTDKKISSDQKKQIPLLTLLNDTVVWIVGIRRSNIALVKTGTKNIVHFSFEKINN
jgi:tRNA(Ile)-lysidine synthase